MSRVFQVHVSYDDEAKVYVATSDDVSGLVVEAPTRDKLMTRIAQALADLLELNRIAVSKDDTLEIIESSSLSDLVAA